MKNFKRDSSKEFCISCEKWFHKIKNYCDHDYLHEELGLKCCHWMDRPLGKASSAHERKRRKRIEEKLTYRGKAQNC